MNIYTQKKEEPVRTPLLKSLSLRRVKLT